jgi:hypothetical protein
MWSVGEITRSTFLRDHVDRPSPKKNACEIFHDKAMLKFANPQLVWFIEQSVSSEVIFYSEVIR